MRTLGVATIIFAAGSLFPVIGSEATDGNLMQGANDARMTFVADASDRTNLAIFHRQDQAAGRADGGRGADDLGASIAEADAGASVSGTKTVSGDLWLGGSITYHVVLSNAGPRNQNDNPGDEFVDILPPELELTGAAAIAGLVTSDPMSNTVTWNGPVPAYASISIDISAVVGSVAVGSTVSNQGTISFDSDGNGSNETQVGTDDPTLPGATDLTEFTVEQGRAIPTLGMVGLLILTAIVAGAGVALLRSRSVY